MTVLVSRDTIQLAATASATNNFYVGRKIRLTRIDSLGKKTVQEKVISAYDGATKVATIDSLWDPNFTPAAGDQYDIMPANTDCRVSINPAIQSLDYITSRTYGRGLDPYSDLQLDTWLSAARICDTRSDVYVRFTGTAPAIGDKYVLGSAAIFQGTVAEITNTDYVRFTDVIGKLSYKWNDWRSFVVGQLVWQDTRLYEVTVAGAKATAPTHTTGTVNGLLFLSSKSLTRTAGAGPASLPIYTDGNPVRWIDGVDPISGYSLYDSDGINYFRLIGWDVNEQRSVTRHQTNISIDTSLPLFDNMNSMLEHFGGILRYSGAKYILEVEQREGTIANIDDEPRNITADHIIGRISITDDGIKNAFNSLTVSYQDPANKFEARNISFFNSDYLKSDRNVPKKGNVTIPGITNYYNARILADKYLTKSRFGLTINMNIVPRGALLLAGKVIQLQYPRYGWVNKKFRIENLTHNDDCTVDVVATEYDDKFYTIGNVDKAPGIGLAGTTAMTTLAPPSGLVATNITNNNELVSAIELKWVDTPGAVSPFVTTEIYASTTGYLQVDVVSITGGTTFTTSQSPHGMQVGQKVISEVTANGLVTGTTYYVASVTANTFTLAATYMGAAITTFTNTAVAFKMTTASTIATVTPPTNSYVDTDIYNNTGARIQKYYWLRYKIDQQS